MLSTLRHRYLVHLALAMNKKEDKPETKITETKMIINEY